MEASEKKMSTETNQTHVEVIYSKETLIMDFIVDRFLKPIGKPVIRISR